MGTQLQIKFDEIDWNEAIIHNQKVKNNYGPQRFIVIHDGGIQSKWSAINRNHLDRLLNIQKNMGYMMKIEDVKAVNTLH